MSFPTTAILDNFTRADENPLSDGGQWSSGALRSTGVLLKVLSNKVSQVDSSGAQQNSQYWNAVQFGPDCEAYLDTDAGVHVTASISPYLRVQNPGGASLNAYYPYFVSGNHPQLRKLNNNGLTILQTGVLTCAAGNSVGGSAVGTVITLYLKQSGVWANETPVTDNSVSGSGFVGIGSQDTGATETIGDNFGGGTFVPPLTVDVITEANVFSIYAY